MGMELDHQLLKQQWRTSVPIATASIIFPFGVGAASAVWLYDINKEFKPSDWAAPTFLSFCLFAGASMSFTAFPVLASILNANKMLNTPIEVQVRR